MNGKYTQIALSKIQPDPRQPRQEFEEAPLADLQQSIERNGVLMPLTVQKQPDGTYVLISGERRWRAASAAGLKTVPCIVSQQSELAWTQVLEQQVAENLHRQDLTPLELAQSLWRAILAANIVAFVDDGEDAYATTLPPADATPTSHIAALEATLCARSGQPSVAAYFQSGQVRIGRMEVLERMGMQGWNEARLRKVLGTLQLAPEVQELLAGRDVSARTLRALADQPVDQQVALVSQALAAAEDQSPIGTQLQQAVKPPKPQQDADDGARADEDDEALDGAGYDVQPEQPATFVPDPALAFLTSSPNASALVTDGRNPTRGSVPPVTPVGMIDEDTVLQMTSALEALQGLLDAAGVLRFQEAHRTAIMQQWDRVAHGMDSLLAE